MDYYKYIGQQIRKARIDDGEKQTVLAQKAGISRASLVNIELGRQGIQIPKLYEIAAILGRPIGFFMPEMSADIEAQKLQDKIRIPVRLLRRLNKLPTENLKELIVFYEKWERKA